MFNKNRELSDSKLKFKNELEEIRFSKEVEDNRELSKIFDEAIDRAENGEAEATIFSRVYYLVFLYIEAHHFKAPRQVMNFINQAEGSVGSGSSLFPVWGKRKS